MVTVTRRTINPINFVDAVYCEIIDSDGRVLATFNALKFPKRIYPLEESIKKNTDIDIYEYI